jgi:phosphatidylethanolamine/phosphatidyl-N-methylethanolamine N-methyltransferase
VVSGLPLLTMNASTQTRLLQQVMEVTGGKGPLIQFSYSLASPLMRTVEQGLGLVSCCVTRVWRNVPPARVWTYEARIVASARSRG